ncbi:MAG: penicillin acylase family protein [Coleofasciculaceae cyanobacterium]
MLSFQSKLSRLFISLSIILILCLGIHLPVTSQNQTEILWDSWGVPHIYSQDAEGLFKAFGWAQSASHGNLVLRLYGQARGQAAEYWGEKYLDSDRYVRKMGIPARAKQWYEAQTAPVQNYLDAFAAGINAYAQENADQIDDQLKVVLPVNGVDVLAHAQRVIHFHFVFNPQRLASGNNNPNPGSNAWAIGPNRSASGNAMLLANPHLPWSDLYLWYEAQLTAPGIDTYGAALVGMPILAIAFNDNLGWTVTVNTFDGADIYELELVDDGYRWDNQVLPLTKESQTILVKQADGSLQQEQLEILSSVHGPIISQTGNKAQALRVVGLNKPQLVGQFWQMAQAKNLSQFEEALKSLELPMFNFIYADRDGQIFYLFNGQVPIRSQGDWQYWQGVVPGNTSQTLWTKYHPYQDLPRLLNPPSGWLQNTNDPPWTTTFPTVLKSQDYPPYLAPPSLGETGKYFRPQRSISMLKENEQISFEEMIDYKFSSHLELAERLLEQLVAAARQLGNELALQAADVLENWDRQANTDSRGAVLFASWAGTMPPADLFATPWQEKSPLTTPSGLANKALAVRVLEDTAARMMLVYGTLDVPWGEAVRLRYGQENLPAAGAPGQLGSFRVLYLAPASQGRFRTFGGDSYIEAIEFSRPVKAKVLNVYGNATQPGSSHIGDQLPLYARSQLRPVWRTRQEILAHLESHRVF